VTESTKPANGVTRSQDEIVARIAEMADTDHDLFGFAREVLVGALDFEHATTVYKAMMPRTWWNTTQPTDFVDEAFDYLDFAVVKIGAHRGVPAGRSVVKLAEYAWLLGRDDIVTAMDAAPYPQYGAPKVKAFADGMGWAWPDDADLVRMAQGLPCELGCPAGCGT
jgi:hypothetical protein